MAATYELILATSCRTQVKRVPVTELVSGESVHSEMSYHTWNDVRYDITLITTPNLN